MKTICYKQELNCTADQGVRLKESHLILFTVRYSFHTCWKTVGGKTGALKALMISLIQVLYVRPDRPSDGLQTELQHMYSRAPQQKDLHIFWCTDLNTELFPNQSTTAQSPSLSWVSTERKTRSTKYVCVKERERERALSWLVLVYPVDGAVSRIGCEPPAALSICLWEIRNQNISFLCWVFCQEHVCFFFLIHRNRLLNNYFHHTHMHAHMYNHTDDHTEHIYL